MPGNLQKFRWKKSGEMSGPDLVRECGERFTDRELWHQFQERFQGLIFMYVMRSLRARFAQQDVTGSASDLAQEVYVKLVQHDGRVLRSFKGASDFSVRAFLARVSDSVVRDHHRSMTTEKRSAQVIPIDQAKAAEASGKKSSDAPKVDVSPLGSVLSLIDIERIIEGDPDKKNARRNALIFQLHYINGLESGEIAAFPGFGLTTSGVQTILARLKKRLQG
jgi:RNA polymerase sigma factor (sigma-70 family)